MFKKLRNRIIIITMTITTVVLVVAGVSIMLISTTTRPEPKVRMEIFTTTTESDETGIGFPFADDENNLREFIRLDRNEGNTRLLMTLLGVGLMVEAVVFGMVYYLSRRIVEPVKDAYDKQKLFIANASHELKTPLAVIQANMEALEVNEENERWKDNIESEIGHANKLVLDLLQLARIDAGEIGEKKLEKVILVEEMKRRVEMFVPRFKGKIELKDKSEGKEWTLPRQDVLQVMDILLDNATKYGEKRIIVELGQNDIMISNDGCKVSKEEAEKIFDRFYQTDKTKEGSGLGLAIAKAICEQNKWEIRCESGRTMTKFIVMLKNA